MLIPLGISSQTSRPFLFSGPEMTQCCLACRDSGSLFVLNSFFRVCTLPPRPPQGRCNNLGVSLQPQLYCLLLIICHMFPHPIQSEYQVSLFLCLSVTCKSSVQAAACFSNTNSHNSYESGNDFYKTLFRLSVCPLRQRVWPWHTFC